MTQRRGKKNGLCLWPSFWCDEFPMRGGHFWWTLSAACIQSLNSFKKTELPLGILTINEKFFKLVPEISLIFLFPSGTFLYLDSLNSGKERQTRNWISMKFPLWQFTVDFFQTWSENRTKWVCADNCSTC